MADSPPRRFSWLQRYPLLGPLAGLLFVLILFEIMIPIRRAEGIGPLLHDIHTNSFGDFVDKYNFLAPYTIGIILTQTVIVATGALGMTLIIISAGIDLSVGSVVALCSVLAAMTLRAGHSSWLAVLVAIAVGALVGLINGSIIARFRMLPFIVTLGMMGIARGLSKLLADNQNVNYKMDSTEGVNALMNNPHTIAAGDVSGATYHMLSWFMGPDPNPASNGALLVPVWLPPVGVLILLALTVMMSLVLNRSVFGRHVFALGSNEDTARLCGLRTRWLKVAVYAVGGLFIGLAGVMQLARLGQGDPTVATGLELDIIAAVVIGGASLNGGVGSIWGSIFGALTMTALRAGTVQMRWSSSVQEIIIGMVIVLAVGLDKIRSRGLKG
jgi:ribose transport system permease protein